MISKHLLFATFLAIAKCSPLIIRSGLGKFDEHSLRENGNVYGIASNAGIANFQAENGFNGDNQKKFTHAVYTGKFAEEDEDKKAHLNEGSFNEGGYQKNDGGMIADYGKQANHKKGHTKSGFHNTYHKDESGSNSSYWDDANDQGDGYTRDTQKKVFGGGADRRVTGLHSEGNSLNRANARNGGYSNGGHLENGHGNKINYNAERFLNDRRQQGVDNVARGYGSSGRRHEEAFHEEPHYFQPYNQRITIYEDPRIPHPQPRFHDRYYDLDIRPPTAHPFVDERFYDRRPNYDYYY